MTLDIELVKEACLELWNDYHKRIEDLGHTLGKDSMMQAIDEISIIATIRPNYSSQMADIFRDIIPQEYLYKGEKIPVIVSPSMIDLFSEE